MNFRLRTRSWLWMTSRSFEDNSPWRVFSGPISSPKISGQRIAPSLKSLKISSSIVGLPAVKTLASPCAMSVLPTPPGPCR